MEQEAKYRATQPIRPKQLEAINIAPFSLGERVTVEIRDSILDTASRQLDQQRYTLRIRRIDQQLWLTLKLPGKVKGAVHQRQEFEHEITPNVRDHPELWPSEIREPLQAVIGDEPLAPMLTVRNRRRLWRIERDGQEIAELALDRGSLVSGERSLPFHEIEIELKGVGTAADLAVLASIYTTQLPLEPETRSKSQRGMLLLNHAEHLEQLKKAVDRTPMESTNNLAEAGRSILAKHVLKLHKAWPIAVVGDDSEGVHQMRVATRRLRTILAILGETLYEPEIVAKLRRGLRQWASVLGAVRDADVFLGKLDDHRADLPEEEQAGYAPLIESISQQRDAARVELLSFLESRKASKFAQRLTDFVLTAGAGVREADTSEGRVERSLVRHWVGSTVWSHYERIRAYDVILNDAPVESLHRLRIEIKHLRYTLELFSAALAEEHESLLEQLVTAQDYLGDLQDAEVALAVVEQSLAETPENSALLAYQAAKQQEHDQLQLNAPKVLRSLFDLPFRRRLASILSKL